MLIGEVLERINSGEKMSNIAKTINGIGEKALRQAMKNAEYEFRNSGKKGWYYIGEEDPPLDKSIFEFVSTKQDKPKSNNKVITDNNFAEKEGNNEVITGNNFTEEEVKALKELAKNFITRGNNEVITNRVQIEKGDRVRKTFHVNKSLVEQLNDLAKQNNMSQSDLLEMALLDLIKRSK
ncbi:ribbon-helix-helix protein, CopG family [Gottfriedia acidiceleris]|uniref:ribbon-helix-helix protein, CopG family n=1 Tax=Gottfriedia acidiceleris TaxID=371036 RepID=UPI002FFDA25D